MITLTSAAVLLFLVLDPLGNVPFFLSALRKVPAARQRRVIARELAIALAVLVVFLFAGRFLLELLHISPLALTMAGGVVLFLIAIRMIFPDGEQATDEDAEEPFIVPLAIPYVAGPSVLATELLFMSREPARWPTWLAALLIAWAATGAVLLFAPTMERILGRRGLLAMERLMGMVLIAIAIQMLLNGILALISAR